MYNCSGFHTVFTIIKCKKILECTNINVYFMLNCVNLLHCAHNNVVKQIVELFRF